MLCFDIGRRPSRSLAGAAALWLGMSGPAMRRETASLCVGRQHVLPWRDLNRGACNVELLKLVAARHDIAFNSHSMPWKRCLEQRKANQVGGAFAVRLEREAEGVHHQ